MAGNESVLLRFVRELRRRRVFRTAGLYVVGAWVVIEAADILFPGWGLADAAINILLVAAVLGFPLALVFGWFFDITSHGIVRTPPRTSDEQALPLRSLDYLLLGTIVLVAVAIIYDATEEVLEAPRDEPGFPTLGVSTEDKPENSIAVLPFANISNDPDNEYFCDGVSEEILNKLSEYSQLRVIARTSSFALKNSNYDVRHIAALLGVRFVLQGSVRKHGDRLRISAQLIGDDSAQRWTTTIDRELEDVFDIQSEIADLVAKEVVPQVAEVAHDGYQPDIEAFELFQQGREYVYQRRTRDAIPILEEAIELNPDYAEAHAELAIALAIGAPSDEDLDRARDAIATALNLSPDLPRAQAATALVLSMQDPADFAGAEAAARAALEKSPSMVDAINWLQGAIRAMGRIEESDVLLEKAYRIDPLHAAIGSNNARRYLRQGDAQAALRIAERLTDIPEPSNYAFMLLNDLHYWQGNLVAMNRAAKARVMQAAGGYYDLALNYALLGRAESAEYWLSRAQTDRPNHPFVPYLMTAIPYWQGDFSAAASLFEQVLAAREKNAGELGTFFRYWLGESQALAGDCAAARFTIASSLDNVVNLVHADPLAVDTLHALAASCGIDEQVRVRIEDFERQYRQYIDNGITPTSADLYVAARNAAVDGNAELALERLRSAIDAGWRDYYVRRNDPRWQLLRGDDRFEALMTEVKADVDRQRREVDRIDAEANFPALLDQVLDRASTD